MKTKTENFGMRVEMWLVDDDKRVKQTLRNVTEIHYNFPSPLTQVAFESSIHASGTAYPLHHIDEFEATLETKKAKHF